MRITVKEIDLLLPLVCTRVDSLALRSEHLRSTFNNIKSSVVDDLDKLSSRVTLLQDNIGQEPGIADFPLRNPWEGIVFLKYCFPIRSATSSLFYRQCLFHCLCSKFNHFLQSLFSLHLLHSPLFNIRSRVLM